MTGGYSQQARVLEATMAVKVFPVDVTDAAQFPEIARATEHAKRLAANGGVS